MPRAVLESLGCRPVRTRRVVLADGRTEEWSVTQTDVECEGRRTTTPSFMGPATGPVLLGATTLEELGLGIDPLNRRLVPVDLYLARAGCGSDRGRLDPPSPAHERSGHGQRHEDEADQVTGAHRGCINGGVGRGQQATPRPLSLLPPGNATSENGR